MFAHFNLKVGSFWLSFSSLKVVYTVSRYRCVHQISLQTVPRLVLLDVSIPHFQEEIDTQCNILQWAGSLPWTVRTSEVEIIHCIDLINTLVLAVRMV